MLNSLRPCEPLPTKVIQGRLSATPIPLEVRQVSDDIHVVVEYGLASQATRLDSKAGTP
jgi:hypothetical protein